MFFFPSFSSVLPNAASWLRQLSRPLPSAPGSSVLFMFHKTQLRILCFKKLQGAYDLAVLQILSAVQRSVLLKLRAQGEQQGPLYFHSHHPYSDSLRI